MKIALGIALMLLSANSSAASAQAAQLPSPGNSMLWSARRAPLEAGNLARLSPGKTHAEKGALVGALLVGAAGGLLTRYVCRKYDGGTCVAETISGAMLGVGIGTVFGYAVGREKD
jgi:hypothetical protein